VYWLRAALISLALLIGFLGCAPVAGADSAQFLDKSALVIALDTVRGDATWPVDVINPSAQPLQVSLQLSEGLSGFLKVVEPAVRTVPPGQTATFKLAPGSKAPKAASGDLVILAGGTVDRRAVQITDQGFFHKYWGRIASLAVLVTVVVIGIVVLTRPKRRRQPAKSRWLLPQLAAKTGKSGTLHSDEPTEHDALDRKPYTEALARIAHEGEPPLVIGVFGEWGSGKTSLLLQIRAELQRDKTCALAWFEPWKFQSDPNPVLPLLHAIVRDLELESSGDVRRSLSVLSETLGSIVLSTTARVSVADLRRTIGAYDQANFRVRSEHTRLDEHFSYLVTHVLKATRRSRLVVFIDDLDRCLPEQILSLLEALKLYLNRPDCVFFLAVDSDRLAKVVASRYVDSGLDGGDYLEKIVQVPFTMPRITLPVFSDYLSSLLTPETQAATPVLCAGLRRNPRSARRLVNILVLQDGLAHQRGVQPYHVAVLATVLLARVVDPEFYAKLETDSTLLRRVAEDLQTADAEGTRWPEAIERCVEALRFITGATFDDVAAYIDLASATPPEPPVVSSSTASSPESSAFPSLGEQSIHVEPVVAYAPSLTTARFGLIRAVEGFLESALPAPENLIPLEMKRRSVGDFPSAPVFPSAGRSVAARDIEEMFDKSGRQLLIVGPPGSGKTVLLLQLAETLLRRVQADPAAPVPVPLFMREWKFSYDKGTYSLPGEIERSFGIPAPEADMLLNDGALALLLDGLDEVQPRGQMRKAAGFIDAFIAQSPGIAVAITCRDSLESVLPRLRAAAEIQPISLQASTDFLQRQTNSPWGSSDVLRELAETPSGLGLLAKHFIETGRPLSGPAADAVEEMVTSMTSRIAAKDVGSVERILGIFAAIARRMQEEGSSIFDTEDSATRALFRERGAIGTEVESIVAAAADEGLLTRQGGSRYAFSHQLINEYFAGIIDYRD
jgi:RecA/RadA recombinase/energy-coupling factor transporter ATP-binding protein EcfA2